MPAGSPPTVIEKPAEFGRYGLEDAEGRPPTRPGGHDLLGLGLAGRFALTTSAEARALRRNPVAAFHARQPADYRRSAGGLFRRQPAGYDRHQTLGAWQQTPRGHAPAAGRIGDLRTFDTPRWPKLSRLSAELLSEVATDFVQPCWSRATQPLDSGVGLIPQDQYGTSHALRRCSSPARATHSPQRRGGADGTREKIEAQLGSRPLSGTARPKVEPSCRPPGRLVRRCSESG